MKDYRVLLYYQYVDIDDPKVFRDEHKAMCDELNLKGRILVSEEGLNGTLSGKVEDIDEYMKRMHADERFAQMPFKIDEADEHAFKKMHVRYRPEIVSLRSEEHTSELQSRFDL